MTEGERVRELRGSLGLTLEKFAAPLNVTKVSVSNVETGRNALSDRLCADICRVYRVSERWLRTGEGEMLRELSYQEDVTAFFEEILSDDIGREFKTRFIWALSRLPVESWQALEKLIDLCSDARK